MDNKTTENGVRRVLRIYVEPIEVELDEENAILITALQSALPGASGLYFRDNDCKSSVRFDGKRLVPPADGWKERKYYATLGCRPFDYPFGSYANAAKQFERSVNSIQCLLANSKLFDYHLIERDITKARKRTEAAQRSPAYVIGNTNAKTKHENMQQLLTAITQKQAASEIADASGDEQKYTPLEQQFVELARISTAKDSIIEQQRADIKVANEKLEQKERSMKNVQEDLSKLMKSCSAREEELAVLHSLGKDQNCMCDKVNELTKKLLECEKTIVTQKKEIEFLVRKIAKLDSEQIPLQKLGTSSESATELVAELPGSHLERAGMRTDEREGEMSYMELIAALDRAKARNEILENEVAETVEKYKKLNEVYATVVAENTKLMARGQDAPANIIVKREPAECADGAEDGGSWNAERLMALRKELAASEKRVAELTRMVHVLTKEASDSELRAADAIATRNEMKRSLDHAETKIQITITK